MAREFDGVSDQIALGSTIELGQGALTLAGWARVSAGGAGPFILSKWTGTSAESWMLDVLGAGNKPRFNVLDTGLQGHGVTAVTALTAGVWAHVAGVFTTGRTIRIYINGVLDNSLTWGSTGGQTDSIRIAGANVFIGADASGGHAKGAVAHVAVWNRALGASELKALYRGDKTPRDLRALNYWPLDALGGPIERDLGVGVPQRGLVTGTFVTDDPPFARVPRPPRRKFTSAGVPRLLIPDAIAATSSITASVRALRAIHPAAINATSAVTGRVAAARPVVPAAITATSTVTGDIVATRAVLPAAIMATSPIMALVGGRRFVIPGAINATSYMRESFPLFTDRPMFGPGNGGETTLLVLAPNGTSETATLATAITDASTLLELTGDGGLPTDAGFCLLIDDEVIYVAKVSAGVYRIRGRGLSNTIQDAHAPGADATWNDSYDMAIRSTAQIDESFMADITASGLTHYYGGLVCFDSSQAYVGGARYPMHVTELLGVFDPGAGSTGANRCDGARSSAIATAAAVSDDCPAALTDVPRIVSNIAVGDVALVRYTNPEAVEMTLGPRVAGLQSWFGLKWLTALGVDVTLSAPHTGSVVDGVVNGQWDNPSVIGINPDTGQPTPEPGPYTSVTMLGTARNFTRHAEKGWPMCALAVRQATKRVPYWRSWDWHEFNYAFDGYNLDTTFVQMLINRNGIVFGSVPEVDLPGTQDIDGPDAWWDDGRYQFGASWMVAIFGAPYLVSGPSFGGGGTSGDVSGTVSPAPGVTFGGGGSVVTTPTPTVEGGSGGGISGTPRASKFTATIA